MADGYLAEHPAITPREAFNTRLGCVAHWAAGYSVEDALAAVDVELTKIALERIAEQVQG